MTHASQSDVITTAAGRQLAIESIVSEDGRVTYRVTYLTPEREIPVGAFVLSPDTSLNPNADATSVYFGIGDEDRHSRSEVPMVGPDTFLVGRTLVTPKQLGPDGEGLHVKLAKTATGTASESGSWGQRQARATDFVAALLGHFLSRADHAEIVLAHGASMAPVRLEAARVKVAAFDKEIAALTAKIAGLQMDRDELSMEVTAFESLLGPDAVKSVENTEDDQNAA